MTEIYFLTVLEAGHPKPRCHLGWFLLRPLCLAGGWLSAPWVFTWSSLCACSWVLISPSYDTRVIID